jgi:hypothetical protein
LDSNRFSLKIQIKEENWKIKKEKKMICSKRRRRRKTKKE